jgi:hypothetical protein
LFRIHPEEKLLGPAMEAMHFMTAKDGMTITGGVGQDEVWTADQDGGRGLAETCATAYQIRVYENLLRLKGDSRYGDLMERTIFNTLFGAQSPDGRRIRYYTPLAQSRSITPNVPGVNVVFNGFPLTEIVCSALIPVRLNHWLREILEISVGLRLTWHQSNRRLCQATLWDPMELDAA